MPELVPEYNTEYSGRVLVSCAGAAPGQGGLGAGAGALPVYVSSDDLPTQRLGGRARRTGNQSYVWGRAAEQRGWLKGFAGLVISLPCTVFWGLRAAQGQANNRLTAR